MKICKKTILFLIVVSPFLTSTITNANEKCDPYSVVNDELEGLEIEKIEYDLNIDNGYKSSGFGYDDFFKSAYWIRRNGMWSLSITPRDRLLNHPHYMYDAWNLLKNRHSSSRHWSYYSDNESVLEQQFYCHVRYGALKLPWNIEPARESINSLTCN